MNIDGDLMGRGMIGNIHNNGLVKVGGLVFGSDFNYICQARYLSIIFRFIGITVPMDDSSSWGFLVLVVIIWSIWEFASFPFSDTVTRYTQSKECKQISSNKPRCEWKNMDRISYKVIEKEQLVITLNIDSGKFIGKLSDCKIFDKENWICTDHFLKYGFRNGEWILQDKDNQANVYKTQWWISQFLSD